MNKKAEFYIENLKLLPHPEGGYYTEVYRSGELIFPDGLPSRFNGSRSFSTSIYFLLEGRQKSLFHKLKSDEVWHHYDGSPARIYILDQHGKLSEITLGKNVNYGEVLQCVIPAETWFAAEVIDKDSYLLAGCTVSPGFDFQDFMLAEREKLLQIYPDNFEIISRFTRP
jgi:uncharacterized protein